MSRTLTRRMRSEASSIFTSTWRSRAISSGDPLLVGGFNPSEKYFFFAPTIPNPRVARVRAAGRPLETPLTVRLWRNCPLSKDQIVGLASKHLQFTLFAVASLNSLATAACSCGYSCCRQTQRKGLCPCPKVFPQWISDIRKANHHVSLSS